MKLTHPALRAVGLLLLFLAGSVPAWGGPGRARTDAVLDRLIRGRGMTIDALGRGKPMTPRDLALYAKRVAIDVESDPPTVRVWMRLHPDALSKVEGLGLVLEARVGPLASASVPLPLLPALAEVPGVEWIQSVRRFEPELDVSIPEVGSDVGASLYGATGAGAVIGIIRSSRV